MKKIILTIASMLAIGAAANAQSDSTYKSESKQSTVSQTSSQTQSQTYPYKASDREEVQSSDLPQSLRQTLGDQRYSGWENATIYRDRTSNDYYFDMQNGSSSTQYRFDKNGKAIQTGPGHKKTSTASKTTTTNEATTGASTDGSRSGSMSETTNDGSTTTTGNSVDGSTTTTGNSVSGSAKNHKSKTYHKSTAQKSHVTK